uniref:LNS2/PITP domain-containing protein n=1 Tax=Ditylenchus dipsaci TaxID=166011 RepID=A0A915DPB2_9BILA
MIYLSSRAIGLSHHTNYLKNVKQGTKKLPDGPVLLSPTSVLMALRKSDRKASDEFKIACLSDLKPSSLPNNPSLLDLEIDLLGHSPERILINQPIGIVSRADRIGSLLRLRFYGNNIWTTISPLWLHEHINNTSLRIESVKQLQKQFNHMSTNVVTPYRPAKYQPRNPIKPAGTKSKAYTQTRHYQYRVGSLCHGCGVNQSKPTCPYKNSICPQCNRGDISERCVMLHLKIDRNPIPTVCN